MKGAFRNSSTSAASVFYSVRELGRRAGMTPESIARWRVDAGDDSVSVYLRPGTNERVVFPIDRTKPHRFRRLRDHSSAHYAWPVVPSGSIASSVPDFVVPFDPRRGPEGAPLFSKTSDSTVECAADLLTATLWTLARAEELDPETLDEHGRFPAAASI
ncbi:MAG: hypothetical protein JO199_03190, partial [Candidatus Eremiobacteraeota bacterium]|nr:hypothetical protein [Candidatus Eremiobacteraeota bacterium]